MTYQEKYVRGRGLRGDRECEARYDLVRDGVSGYTRPFSVLDLGANIGYFGLRLADEFGATSVMIERRPDLAGVCRENALPGTIAIRRRLSVADLEELAKSEHFDVVLALNIIHHFKSEWRAAFNAILRLGDRIIIETPSADDVNACGQGAVPGILSATVIHGTFLGRSPCHTTPGALRPMYLLRGKKKKIEAGYCFGERLNAPPIRTNSIASTTESKVITIGDEKRDWIHGMNLWNFAQLGGTWPTLDAIDALVVREAARHPDHGDVRPWNFILGDGVHLIDGNHRKKHTGDVALEETRAWIREPNKAYAWARRENRASMTTELWP